MEGKRISMRLLRCIVSLMMVLSLTANASLVHADSRPKITNAAEKTEGGLRTSKKLELDENGKGKITLEVASEAEVQTTNQPTDVVLVLDQSGSMRNNVTSTEVSYKKYPNQNLSNKGWYDKRNNMYLLESDGTYTKINVTRDTKYTLIGGFIYAYTYTAGSRKMTSNDSDTKPDFSSWGVIYERSEKKTTTTRLAILKNQYLFF